LDLPDEFAEEFDGEAANYNCLELMQLEEENLEFPSKLKG
jgi:hypothetical protein